MTLDSLVVTLHDTELMVPLLCSLVAGVLIGVEREFQGKAAGVRTHALLCFASAILTLLGLRMAEWTSNLSADTQVVSDLARMPHAILTGVGFLGAGVIFREGPSVHGLTTAASLWLTAALGIVFGTGLLELGTIGTAAALTVLFLLRVVQSMTLRHPALRLEIAVNKDSPYDCAELAAYLSKHDLKAGPISQRQDHASGLRHFALVASSTHSAINAERLAKSLQDEQAVLEFSVIPLENESLEGG